MKSLKFPLIALLVAGLLTIAFIGCKKEMNSPSLTSDAKGSVIANNSTPVFTLSLPDADVMCETSTTYCFSTTLLNNGGQTPGGQTTISAKISDLTGAIVATSATLEASSGSVCFSDLALIAGSYMVKVHYDHVQNPNEPNTQQADFEFPLTVQSSNDCGITTCQTTGLTFSRTPVVILDQGMKPIQVDVTYTVTNCTADQTFNNLKIQGGLVNKASEPSLTSSGTGYIISYKPKSNGANYIITGYFNLAPGQYSSFNVVYKVQTACDNYLTGEWSVKNGPIPVIDPTIAGTESPYYVNRLYSKCP
jgi:hypothetical protein